MHDHQPVARIVVKNGKATGVVYIDKTTRTLRLVVKGKVKLTKTRWKVPAEYPFGTETVVPLRAGQTIGWRLAGQRLDEPRRRRLFAALCARSSKLR